MRCRIGPASRRATPRRGARAPRCPPPREARAGARSRIRRRGRRVRTSPGQARSGTPSGACRRRRRAGAAWRRARRGRPREARTRSPASTSATTTSSCASATRPSSTAIPASLRRRRHLTLAPGDGDAFELHRRRRERLVDHVHALEQVAELVLPEHLLQPRAVRRVEDELRGIAVELQVSAHRRELLRRPRLLGVLAERAAARGRELVHVLEHALEGAVLRDQLPGCLVPDARNSRDVVGGVALEPDEVGHLLRE